MFEERDVAARTALKEERKRWLEQSGKRFVSRGFVLHQVIPLVPELSNGNKASYWSAEVVRAKRTGRMTLRYDFNGFGEIYGKAYDDSLGSSAYQLLEHLWGSGFGPRSDRQVPEPLGFLPQENVLLMRGVGGVPLSDLAVDGPMQGAVRGMQSAAGWLADFHASKIPSLQVEPPCERIRIFKIATQLARVAAACPDRAALLLDLLHQLKRIAPDSNFPQRLVPLNGQFRPEHVFVDGEKVAVIDLEKISLSDPAKDVALITHKIKEYCFESGGDVARARLLADEFVNHYRTAAADSLANLPYFASVYCLKSVVAVIKSSKLDQSARARIEQLYLSDFQRWTQESCT